jgi:hypothetical protein
MRFHSGPPARAFESIALSRKNPKELRLDENPG